MRVPFWESVISEFLLEPFPHKRGSMPKIRKAASLCGVVAKAIFAIIGALSPILSLEVPMAYRILTLLSAILGVSSIGVAQQGACKTVEVPVGVISISGDVFRGLAAEDFVGRMQNMQKREVA